MTIGQKIVKLRLGMDISQEQLAERLGVSRQSVSKWEMDQALPQIDKVLLICDLFNVSADELLKDKIVLSKAADGENTPNKYFGTDGFRGEANTTLTSIQAYKVGRFLGWYYSSSLSGNTKANYRPKIVVGKDTRRSSYMLEYALCSGIIASGGDAYILHVTTTPSVSYVVRTEGFDCGIMITASHNPFYDNGIKLINRYGEKFDDDATRLIEEYIDGNFENLGINGDDLPFAKREKIGKIVDYVSGRNRYVGYLISLGKHSFKNFKVALDCANGASVNTTPQLLRRLGVRTITLNANPDGMFPGHYSEPTEENLSDLKRMVVEFDADLGIAHDGDADRVVFITGSGRYVAGDKSLAFLARRMVMSNGGSGEVVTTVATSSLVGDVVSSVGGDVELTAVGSPVVARRMIEDGGIFGGEENGGLIFADHQFCRDGAMGAARMLESIIRDGDLDSQLDSLPVYHTVKDAIECDPSVLGTMVDRIAELHKDEDANRMDGLRFDYDDGWVLLRPSGTEPKFRIYSESRDPSVARRRADEFKEEFRALSGV